MGFFFVKRFMGNLFIYSSMGKLYTGELKNVGGLSGFYGSVKSLSKNLQAIFEESGFPIREII